jgi:hemoglobin
VVVIKDSFERGRGLTAESSTPVSNALAGIGRMGVVSTEAATFYDEIGGYDVFHRLVAKFYEGVAEDPVLRPLYPEEDLGPAEERFRLFLIQYWGGPTTYSDNRGHPRLRMRHAPFAVTPAAAQRWLVHFREALDSVQLTPEQDARFWEYVTHAAQFMVNSFDE